MPLLLLLLEAKMKIHSRTKLVFSISVSVMTSDHSIIVKHC
jgi:hypothetical protein